jgi:uncharacterized membrane-anchored protein
MRIKLSIAAIALQIAVLAYMGAEREWVVRAGRTIYLRTAPLDPRDVMRGDYVRLNYEVSRVPRSLWQGSPADTNSARAWPLRDTKVYASVREDEEGVAELVALSDRRPEGGVFLRGRSEPSWGVHVSVRYGLEAYFMEQGKAWELEQRQPRDGIQVPLEMAVAVNSRGLAVLKGHRWCKLGVGLEIETMPLAQTNRPRARQAIAAKVKLSNATTNALAIVDLPGGRSLALVPDLQWGEAHWQWASAEASPPKPEARHVVLLKPGDTYTMRVSFNDPGWFVRGPRPGEKEKVQTRSLADLDGDFNPRFRFEYRAPTRSACAGLPNEQLIWHGRLASRAFSPAGAID